jgi:hypothetical protein
MAAMIMLAQHRTKCDSGCDSTGLSTRKYGRWFEVRNSRREKKRKFVELHAHTTTDADRPFFLSAKGTKRGTIQSEPFQADGRKLLDPGNVPQEYAVLKTGHGSSPMFSRANEIVKEGISLAELKRFALHNLPDGALRDDILSQPEAVSPEDYLANCRVWLRLLRLRR